jgi:hypothetical protein
LPEKSTTCRKDSKAVSKKIKDILHQKKKQGKEKIWIPENGQVFWERWPDFHGETMGLWK